MFNDPENVFKSLDKDHSGFLEVNEFRLALTKLRLQVSPEEAEFLMATIDANNDGKISKQEFLELVELAIPQVSL